MYDVDRSRQFGTFTCPATLGWQIAIVFGVARNGALIDMHGMQFTSSHLRPAWHEIDPHFCPHHRARQAELFAIDGRSRFLSSVNVTCAHRDELFRPARKVELLNHV